MIACCKEGSCPSHQVADVKVQCCVIVRLRLVQIGQEVYVSPHVVFVLNVIRKALQEEIVVQMEYLMFLYQKEINETSSRSANL